MILFLMLGYLIGSIPFGLLLTKLSGLGDIRSIGSGNIGATNVLRTGKKSLAVLTLILDMSKSSFSGFLVFHMTNNSLIGDWASLMAVIGHVFPVWLRFKGGKGVASGIGAVLFINIELGILTCCLWLLTAFVSKYSSLSALIAFSFLPLYSFPSDQDTEQFFIFLVLSILIISRHHQNIKRLISGQETKINLRKSS